MVCDVCSENGIYVPNPPVRAGHGNAAPTSLYEWSENGFHATMEESLLSVRPSRVREACEFRDRYVPEENRSVLGWLAADFFVDVCYSEVDGPCSLVSSKN